MNEIIPVVIVLVAGMIILIVRLFTLRMRVAEINYFVDLVSEIADQMERGYSITEAVSGIIKNNEGHKCTKILQRIMDAYNNGEDISAVKEEINKDNKISLEAPLKPYGHGQYQQIQKFLLCILVLLTPTQKYLWKMIFMAWQRTIQK